MALGNILVDGSYTIIDNIKYSAQTRTCRFDVLVYRDSTKVDLIANLRKGNTANEKHFEFKGFITELDYPSDAEVGDVYIVQREEFKSDQHNLVTKRESGGWHRVHPEHRFCATDQAGTKYRYVVTEDKWAALPPGELFDFEKWDQSFSFEAQQSAGNLLKCAYNYLKLFPEYANATDC